MPGTRNLRDLHLWPDAGIVEVVEEGRAVPPGIEGDLVCTGLTNAAMPLIRYRIGDRGVLDASDQPCPCGRTLPVLSRISGRSSDLLLARDGRVVYWLNPVFYGLALSEAQIVQESLEIVKVRYVAAPDFSSRHAATLIERLHERLGRVQVVLERVDRIPRGPNGKFRPVVCMLSQ
jgi:phenylacetate-CoA ligase